jgi:hypothetical protein
MNPTPEPPHVFRPGRHLEIFDDPSHDPYQDRAKLPEPSVCTDCGAVYHRGRWEWAAAPPNAGEARCTACRRIREDVPAGYVTIEGQFAMDHRDEIIALIKNLEAREKAEHPLQRVMSLARQDSRLVVTTTDVHLARGIGEALEHAYKGDLEYQYSKDTYLLRVHWQR